MLQPTIYHYDAIMATPISHFPNPEKPYPQEWIDAMKEVVDDMPLKVIEDLVRTLNTEPLNSPCVKTLMQEIDLKYFLNRSIVGPEYNPTQGGKIADLSKRNKYANQEYIMVQCMSYIETAVVGPTGVSQDFQTFLN